MVIATQLWGFFAGDTARLTAAQEIEANRRYFLETYALPMLIAIDSTAKEYDPMSEEERYRVDRITDMFVGLGYPSFVVVDRRGVVRGQFTGFDQVAIDELVQKLFAEEGS